MFEKYISLLKLMDLVGGVVDGRKKLQKLVYLVQQGGGPFAEVFQYHLYGPFSEQLANEVEEMKSFGLIAEANETVGSRQSGYSYSITDKGRFLLPKGSDTDDLVVPRDTVRELGQSDARDLELKATVLFLTRHNCPREQIAGVVGSLKPEQNYTSSEVTDSLRYLAERQFPR